MRFSHILLATLALAAPISSQFTNQPCTNAPGECKSCVGTSTCCGDNYSVDYGHCGIPLSVTNCPSGALFTTAPTSVTCDFRADDCSENLFCWGTITCSGDCPEGYTTGDFCYQDGTAEVKVCGTGAVATEAPTTAPTDSAPTGGANPQPTETPATEAPTTEAPATEAPATEAPATEAPTTEAPTTEAPATEAPATEAPTEAPTTEAPTTEAPATEAPTTEAPTAETPTTEAPTAEAPTTEAPTAEVPTTEAPTAEAPTTEAPATQAPTSTPTGGANPQGPTPNAGGEVPTPDNVVCYQEIVGSLTGTYAQVSADLDLWQERMHAALNLTGPINLSVGHAQVPDRNSFENNCTGPYQTVADLFVHIQTSQDDYDRVSAALEAFIAANPVTSYTSISCSARSVTTYLPRCGKTDVDITFPTPRPNPQRNDAAVLCYQEVVGSLTGNYTQLNAELDAWQLKMYQTLGLTGPIELTVGHAQIPDRVDFENNCTGPYAVMADLFIHIPTTYDQYDTLAARLADFIAANPFTRIPTVSCSATSIVTFLPGCGKIPNPTTNSPAPASPQQPNYQYCPVVTYNHRVVDAGSVPSGKKLYTIVYDVTSANQRITYVDVHITTASGFYNYRMPAASTTSYQLTFPNYLALDGGERMNYWFTTQSTSDAFPQPFACDSPSYNYTTSGTPIATNPTQPPVPTVPCPSATFDYDVQRVGVGSVNGTSTYAITFTPTGNSAVDWVDVHLTANGGQFNYRMDKSNATSAFRTVLPSPHLNLRDGAALSYWYTYFANNTACDTGVYNTNVAAA